MARHLEHHMGIHNVQAGIFTIMWIPSYLNDAQKTGDKHQISELLQLHNISYV